MVQANPKASEKPLTDAEAEVLRENIDQEF